MKILFMLPTLSVGGLERVQVTIANALANRGHDVTVMTYMEGNELAAELDPRVRFVYRERRPFPLMRKIPYIRYKFYDDGMWETRACAKQLHKYYIGKEHYDVEIGFFRGMAVKTISAYADRTNPKKGKAPKTVHLAWVHTDFKKAGGYQNNFQNMKEVFEAYGRMDRVVCVSEQAMDGFKAVVGDTGNLSVVYNLLPLRAIREKSLLPAQVEVPRAGFHIVHVGRLIDAVKGQKRLSDAVIRLRNEGFDISLVLVGDGQDREMLQNHIRENNAGSYITMVGNQLNPYPYMKQADLLVCASQFEGFGLFVAESMIVGTPVLSTDCTGPNEILGHGEYGVIVENSGEGIYNGLKDLLQHRERLDVLRQKTAERIGFFDEEVILQQIESLFNGANA